MQVASDRDVAADGRLTADLVVRDPRRRGQRFRRDLGQRCQGGGSADLERISVQDVVETCGPEHEHTLRPDGAVREKRRYDRAASDHGDTGSVAEDGNRFGLGPSHHHLRLRRGQTRGKHCQIPPPSSDPGPTRVN